MRQAYTCLPCTCDLFALHVRPVCLARATCLPCTCNSFTSQVRLVVRVTDHLLLTHPFHHIPLRSSSCFYFFCFFWQGFAVQQHINNWGWRLGRAPTPHYPVSNFVHSKFSFLYFRRRPWKLHLDLRSNVSQCKVYSLSQIS